MSAETLSMMEAIRKVHYALANKKVELADKQLSKLLKKLELEQAEEDAWLNSYKANHPEVTEARRYEPVKIQGLPF